jgi:Ca-activated chloride channel homolog
MVAMGRQRLPSRTATWLVASSLVVGLTVFMALAVYFARPRGDLDLTPNAPDGGCARALRVVTSSSFAPVLANLQPGLDKGDDCVRLNIDVADGLAATQRLGQADVWIPDDAAWAGTATGKALAAKGTAGSGTVLATSPIYMVTDAVTADRLKSGGSTWSALAALLTNGSGVRLAVRDPAGSGDGLVAAGAVAEAVWLDKGMDASALELSETLRATRTVTGGAPALPTGDGEIGLVPEYALVPELGRLNPGMAYLSGVDHVATMRFTWLPTAASGGIPTRTDALRRLLSTLTGKPGAEAIRMAGLRLPDGLLGPDRANGRLPTPGASPFDVLQKHHADHVFATWYAESRKMSLLIVTDISGSMAKPAPGTTTPLIDLVRQGCQTVGDLLPADARLGVWEFGANLDPPRDYRTLAPIGPLDDARRADLRQALGTLAAQETGTGLYDTILAAYQTARDNYQAGMPNQVMVFTDGRNEDDPQTITPAQLTAGLAAAEDPARPVQLSVVTFGDLPEAGLLEDAVKPVDGYVEPLKAGNEVAATFIHLAAGGLHG